MFRRRGVGLLGTAVIAGGAAHMGARSAQRSQAEADQEAMQNQQLYELQAQQAAAAAPPAANPADDAAAQIQKFAALKGQGLITEEEFEAKKKQILGI
jgi:Short C-terminal domain